MIIFCEPQCCGFEHAEVNAAFLAAVSSASSEEILFFAEECHLKIVQKRVETQSIHNVTFKAITVPKPGTINLLRFPDEMRLADKILNDARSSDCNQVVFTSITSPGLISIKLLLKKFPGIKCTVIPHGILESVVKRPAILPWHFIFWFRFAMGFRNSDQLSYLVLGEPIKDRLCQLLPSVRSYLRTITLPTFFMNPQEKLPYQSGLVRVGIFGVAHYSKGFELFFRMANEITAGTAATAAEFILIGHIGDKRLKKAASAAPVTIPSPDKPLNRDDFDRYAESIDYSIYFYKPTSYQLTASGALFDAFSYVKPIIALRNPFFEYYFQQMGDIGYLCENYDEMKSVLLEIIKNKPVARYCQQVANILAGREKISIDNLGIRLKTILEL